MGRTGVKLGTSTDNLVYYVAGFVERPVRRSLVASIRWAGAPCEPAQNPDDPGIAPNRLSTSAAWNGGRYLSADFIDCRGWSLRGFPGFNRWLRLVVCESACRFAER